MHLQCYMVSRGGDVVPGVVVYLSMYGSGEWVRSIIASYADILWARHAIFLPHERVLKRMGTFPTLCSKRSAREHVEITEEPIDAWLLFNRKPIISYDRTTPQEGD